MTPNSTSLDRRFIVIAFALATLPIVVASVVLVGWYLHVGWLTGVATGVAMRANTASAFMLAGTALLLNLRPSSGPCGRALGRLLSLVVTLIGALTLSQYIWSCDLHIDQLLVHDPQPPSDNFYPGRMSPMTATTFTALGMALMLTDVKGIRGVIPAEVFALVALSISGMALIGYTYASRGLYDIRVFTQMALHTATCFVALSLGILCAKPDRGVMRLVSAPLAGSVMVRRLLFVTIAIPLALGWIRVKLTDAGLVGVESGVAMLITSIIVLLTILILAYAGISNRADSKRLAMEKDIRHRIEHEQLLVEEMNHRVRNNLGAIIGLINSTQQAGTDITTFAESISRRVEAMATVHTMLAASRWEAVSLKHVVHAITSRHPGTVVSPTVDIKIPARQVPAVAMVLNELFTNSWKHGALSVQSGVVKVAWDCDQNPQSSRTHLRLSWREAGGPQIDSSPSAGTGTHLINGFLRHELHGHIESRYGRAGAEHEISIELDRAVA